MNDVIEHSTSTLSSAVQQIGQSGVDIFFVISGFVIARISPGVTPADFMWQRIRRIFPIYYISFVPTAVVYFESIAHQSLPSLTIATAFLWPATTLMTYPLGPSTWTLCYEMLFYYGMTLLLIDRRFIFGIFVIFALAVFFRKSAPIFEFVGNPLIIEFALGVAVAQLPKLKISILIIPICFAIIVVVGSNSVTPSANFLARGREFERLIMFGIPAVGLVYGAIHIEVRRGIWTKLGDASYSIYLFHYVLLNGLVFFWQHFHLSITVITVVSISIIISVCLFIYEAVEKPLLAIIPRQVPLRNCADALR